MQLRRFLVPVAVAAVLVSSIGVAAAGTKSSGTTSWIALHQPDGTSTATNWQPSLGDVVTYDSGGYAKNVKSPLVDTACYQNGVLVYEEYSSTDLTQQMSVVGRPGPLLGGASSTWLDNGGAANCVANLFYFSYKGSTQTYNLLASTSFSAAG